MTFIELTPDVTGTRNAVAGGSFKGIPTFAVRQDADGASEADGDFTPLLTNEDGRLKVASKAGTFPSVSGTIAAIGNTVFTDVSNASNVTVHVKGGSVASTGIVLIFEASVDSTNGSNGTWFTIQGVRTNANTIETSTAASALNLATGVGVVYAHELSVNAYQWLRVRATARTTGDVIATLIRGVYATEPIPAIQSHGISGTVATSLSASPTTTPAKAEDAIAASGDVGMFALSVRRDAMGTSPTSASGDYQEIATDVHGAVWVRERNAPTGTITSVTSTTASQTLLAANTNRRGAMIKNESTAVLYVAFAATASATAYTKDLIAGEYYEVPAFYSGIITGIWASANGAARVTEITV